jgi:Stigma-specific protein, Stig1
MTIRAPGTFALSRQRGLARNHRSDFIVVGSLVIGFCLASFGARAQPMSCPVGQIACPVGNCVDTSTDTRNCGGCGNSCAIGQACTAGACVTLSCPAGQSLCSSSCINTSTDIRNCGRCGNSCAIGQACTAGVCVTLSCPAGQSLCSGSCINTSTDIRNCGTCGNSCAIGQACTAGMCTSVAPPPDPGVFACQFTVGNLAGNTIVPTGITLSGPAGQPCSNNYGSSGFQVRPPFACQFTVGKLAGNTIVPTGITLTGPAGASCTDNYGSSGTQVSAQN